MRGSAEPRALPGIELASGRSGQRPAAAKTKCNVSKGACAEMRLGFTQAAMTERGSSSSGGAEQAEHISQAVPSRLAAPVSV